jgi:hypothetical protein
MLRRFELPGVVRVSLGVENIEDDVDTLIHMLGEIARQPRGSADKKAAQRLLDGFATTVAHKVYA